MGAAVVLASGGAASARRQSGWHGPYLHGCRDVQTGC